jgi:hypothetical protein
LQARKTASLVKITKFSVIKANGNNNKPAGLDRGDGKIGHLCSKPCPWASDIGSESSETTPRLAAKFIEILDFQKIYRREKKLSF